MGFFFGTPSGNSWPYKIYKDPIKAFLKDDGGLHNSSITHHKTKFLGVGEWMAGRDWGGEGWPPEIPMMKTVILTSRIIE